MQTENLILSPSNSKEVNQMATETVNKVKFKLVFDEDLGSYIYSNIKTTASDEDVYGLALGFKALQKGVVTNCYKIVESVLTR